MTVLDSPLDVLPLDYLGFGFLTVVNNVWTWVAVITAAVSVWRIRTSSPRHDHFPSKVSLIKPAVSSSAVERSARSQPASATPVTVEVPLPPPPCPSVFNSEGRTSGKFTFYIREENEFEEEANVDEDGDGNEENKQEPPVRNGWETTIEMRMVDHMGFYRYQDLTVLDENVVRLWDGCRSRSRTVINAASMVRCGGNDWSS